MNSEYQKIRALENRNASKYYLICEELGAEPEDRYLYQQGILEVQENFLKEQKLEKIMNDKNVSLVLESSRIGISQENPYSDRKRKENLIKSCLGYSRLRGGRKIEDCPDAQIGKVFERAFNAGIKLMKE